MYKIIISSMHLILTVFLLVLSYVYNITLNVYILILTEGMHTDLSIKYTYKIAYLQNEHIAAYIPILIKGMYNDLDKKYTHSYKKCIHTDQTKDIHTDTNKMYTY